MEALFRYYTEALDQDAKTFAAKHPHLFLLKRPSPDVKSGGAPASMDDEDDSPATQLIGAEVEPGVFNEQGPMAAEWRVAPLEKKPGFPPADRIVVGRTRTCDVVLPFGSVSKVHAHFHLENGKVARLSDQQSSNGTFLNDRRLEPGESAVVKPGDKVRFGALELEIVDAATFYEVLGSSS